MHSSIIYIRSQTAQQRTAALLRQRDWIAVDKPDSRTACAVCFTWWPSWHQQPWRLPWARRQTWHQQPWGQQPWGRRLHPSLPQQPAQTTHTHVTMASWVSQSMARRRQTEQEEGISRTGMHQHTAASAAAAMQSATSTTHIHTAAACIVWCRSWAAAHGTRHHRGQCRQGGATRSAQEARRKSKLTPHSTAAQQCHSSTPIVAQGHIHAYTCACKCTRCHKPTCGAAARSRPPPSTPLVSTPTTPSVFARSYLLCVSLASCHDDGCREIGAIYTLKWIVMPEQTAAAVSS